MIFALLAFAAGTGLVVADVAQTTGSGSWCSPAQNGNGNTVICNGVDPRAMNRLNELLDRKDLDLELCRKIGDGVNQAADLISAAASIPSLNFIPLTTFGNWF